MSGNLESLVTRLEAVTKRLESVQVSGAGGAGGAADEDPAWLDEFNATWVPRFMKFVTDTEALNLDDLKEFAALIKNAFQAHTDFLVIAGRNGRPSAGDNQTLLKPMSTAINEVQSFRESHRPSKSINFLSAVSEGIPFLGWVTVAPKPANYVTQMVESAQFYTNKILKEFRQSDPPKADWSNSFIKLIKEFAAYVKDHHSTGIMWNKDKPAATGATTATGGGSTSAPAPPPPRAPGAPPPPPPPAAGAPPPPPPTGGKSGGAAPDASALFAQINQGGAITSGLKKVSDDQKTHKNPALRSSATVSATAPRPYSPPQFKKFTAPGSAKAPPVKKPPVFELQAKKWVVENQENNQNLLIEESSESREQTVYMFKCNNSMLQVKGKMNSITLDNCKKCGVVFEDLISTVEFINCQSVKAQVNGAVPTVSIDKTDGCVVYLREQSMGTQIITAKSSEMNIAITKDNGDYTEFPVPEQFKTEFDEATKKFKTTTMDLNL